MATPPGPPSGTPSSTRLDLDEIAASMGAGPPSAGVSEDETACPVLRAAASGVMWLTGQKDGPPLPVRMNFVDRVGALCDAVGWASNELGQRVRLDPVQVVIERAAGRGFTRNGTTSANGSCRLLGCKDGWVVCNLARPDDSELLPAVTGAKGAEGWEALQQFASDAPAAEFARRAQLVGLPAGVVADRSTRIDPVELSHLGVSVNRGHRAQRVVDFSAMWAGPLCAHALRSAGADVTTVEDPHRPDGSRLGDPGLHARLHAGHGLASYSFQELAGQEAIRRLVDAADVVVESSRPRALAQLGLSPQA
ncbi:MAG: CoA transferase, partial [Acidimicrobiales bacterium]